MNLLFQIFLFFILYFFAVKSAENEIVDSQCSNGVCTAKNCPIRSFLHPQIFKQPIPIAAVTRKKRSMLLFITTGWFYKYVVSWVIPTLVLNEVCKNYEIDERIIDCFKMMFFKRRISCKLPKPIRHSAKFADEVIGIAMSRVTQRAKKIINEKFTKYADKVRTLPPSDFDFGATPKMSLQILQEAGLISIEPGMIPEAFNQEKEFLKMDELLAGNGGIGGLFRGKTKEQIFWEEYQKEMKELNVKVEMEEVEEKLIKEAEQSLKEKRKEFIKENQENLEKFATEVKEGYRKQWKNRRVPHLDKERKRELEKFEQQIKKEQDEMLNRRKNFMLAFEKKYAKERSEFDGEEWKIHEEKLMKEKETEVNKFDELWQKTELELESGKQRIMKEFEEKLEKEKKEFEYNVERIFLKEELQKKQRELKTEMEQKVAEFKKQQEEWKKNQMKFALEKIKMELEDEEEEKEADNNEEEKKLHEREIGKLYFGKDLKETEENEKENKNSSELGKETSRPKRSVVLYSIISFFMYNFIRRFAMRIAIKNVNIWMFIKRCVSSIKIHEKIKCSVPERFKEKQKFLKEALEVVLQDWEFEGLQEIRMRYEIFKALFPMPITNGEAVAEHQSLSYFLESVFPGINLVFYREAMDKPLSEEEEKLAKEAKKCEIGVFSVDYN